MPLFKDLIKPDTKAKIERDHHRVSGIGAPGPGQRERQGLLAALFAAFSGREPNHTTYNNHGKKKHHSVKKW